MARTIRTFFRWLLDAARGGRLYLLADGEHSCMYVPKRTHKALERLLVSTLALDGGAENSLRFLWSKMDGGKYVLTVNPSSRSVELSRTHGLALDAGRRVIVPCPYLQHIYQAYRLPPEWCGRLYLEEISVPGDTLPKTYVLSAA